MDLHLKFNIITSLYYIGVIRTNDPTLELGGDFQKLNNFSPYSQKIESFIRNQIELIYESGILSDII